MLLVIVKIKSQNWPPVAHVSFSLVKWSSEVIALSDTAPILSSLKFNNDIKE